MFPVATAHAAAARVPVPVLAAVSAGPARAAVASITPCRDCCFRGGCFLVTAPWLRLCYKFLFNFFTVHLMYFDGSTFEIDELE
jgi:hypothetical protein